MASQKDPFDKDDPAGQEVAIRAGLEKSGVSIEAKSRAIAALDRLIGAALDIPGIWFERRAERARIIATAEQELLKIDANAALKRRRNEAQDDRDRISSWLNEAKIATDNRTGVANAAIEEIKLLENDFREERHIEDYSLDDWLNAFVRRAEAASSDQMRSILGRILAGEILRPGSFSIATLRIIAELDQIAAKSFQELCAGRIAEGTQIAKPRPEFFKNDLLLTLYDLEERGLLKEVGGNLGHDLVKTQDGFYYFLEKDDIVRFTYNDADVGSSFFKKRANVILLTRAGRELAKLLPYDPDLAIRSIAQSVHRDEILLKIELIQKQADGSGIVSVLYDRNIQSSNAE